MENEKARYTIKEKAFKAKYESVLQKHRTQQCKLARPVDYSFLNTMNSGFRINTFFLKTAVIFLIFIMTVSVGVVFVNSNIALAARFELEKEFYKLNSTFFTTEHDPGITVNEEVTIVFKSLDQIGKAKKFMNHLYFPEYIPSGQQLQNLTIKKLSTYEFISEYSFIDQNGNTLFIMMHDTDEIQDYNISAEGQITELKDRTLFEWSEPVTGEDGIDVILKNHKIRIIGTISHEEKAKVAEGLSEF